jgi:hypothetical protein
LIFVREVSDPLTRLVKQIDQQLEGRPSRPGSDRKLGVFVIFCSSDPKIGERLKDQLAKEPLKTVVLCTTTPGGPPRYRVAGEADLTAAVYNGDRQVTANFALEKGGLTADKSRAILEAIVRVVPSKKIAPK